MANVRGKCCSKCKLEKHPSNFYTDRQTPDGLSYRCKECFEKKIRSSNIIADLPDEIWTDAIFNKGKYLVSTLGRIKSLERKVKISDGKDRRVSSRILKPSLCKGYMYVELHKRMSVHTIVFYSFNLLLSKLDGYVVDHIDENKSNNKLNNLQLITHAENVQKNYILKRTKTSKYKNVCFLKLKNKWQRKQIFNGKKITKLFNTEEEAALPI